MWLLDVLSHELKLFEGQVPPYAILSHRWEEDEVTFVEVIERRHECRKGWAKIQASCEMAAGDGYAYIWADTCCIDKKSSAELSEAINSMFRWYQDSKVCYAYLCDVSDAVQLTQSLWFTRGWTLQELLAPIDVLFFNSSWTCIGSKFEHAHHISQRTGIPEASLTRFNPGTIDHNNLGVAQIMSWAAQRKTTRIEDRAYSLMGLFDVNMPLMYGEGSKAFLRLQHEIMQSSNDLSLFAWEGPSVPSLGMLAASPDAFGRCQAYIPCYHDYTITKHALVVETPVIYPFVSLFAMRVITVSVGFDEELNPGQQTSGLEPLTSALSGCVLLMRYSSDPLMKGKFFRVMTSNKSLVFIPTTYDTARSLELDKIEIKRPPPNWNLPKKIGSHGV